MGCFASKHVAEPLVEQQQRGATPKDTDACQPQQQPEPVSVVCDGKGTIKVKSPFRDLATGRPTGAAVVLLLCVSLGRAAGRHVPKVLNMPVSAGPIWSHTICITKKRQMASAAPSNCLMSGDCQAPPQYGGTGSSPDITGFPVW